MQVLEKDFKFLLNGEWSFSSSNQFINIYSPSTGEVVGRVPAMTKDEIDKAVAGARKAQKKWEKLAVSERAKILHAWADELVKMIDVIAPMIMNEVGKNISTARKEVTRTAEIIRYTAEEGVRIHGEFINGGSLDADSSIKTAIVEKKPLGVILAISPFNYPINLAATKIAPALIAGNAVVFKPATQGAISGLLMIQALENAGLPKGLVNTVTGKGSEIGDYIITHPFIDMISFTGGTGTGQNIARKASMIPLVLELGGKDPAIVLEDADLELAATEIVSGAFSYSGQRCTAIKRVLVLKDVAAPLIEKIKEKVEKLTVGRPEDDADITPLIDESSADFVQGLIDDALAKGASLITGNKREKNLIYPTVLSNVTKDMKVAWEEPFGPVLPCIIVDSVEEAIEIANESEFGLQASVFTSNIEKAFTIASSLDVGSVQINGRTERGPDHFPFSAVKNSGLGSQGIRQSIISMMRDKVTVINLKK
ncbi:NADP-dependent glyceraldehyde-3-phosphate dehydrogenase [Bacillus methanolicus]|uniref:NADP-dependent glyceraldehyde-3-phosphate dehydrogenase n=1 Tax=Bacillus methanolicus TaxID=1471 RepID=UPI00200ECD01|nr:NADP-dependent glyceraldehyde-3-phosphate dehydrogenase [Bacillus methanolicus]UQD53547.1 NADP-dependent glyceraldehyde-3-phosphate dehydrogenase [Bacillus methanolicus]